MSHALVLLWLGTSSARAAHQPDLDSWQRARQVAFEAPATGASSRHGYDRALADRIEKLLDEARIAAGSLDEKTALSRLAVVDRLLHAHAELPQAAWLMAERLEVEADVYDRRADGAVQAAKLRARARSLEGRRALSYTTAAEAHEADRKEPAPSPVPTPGPAAPAPHAMQQLTAKGLLRGDQLYVDARRVGAHFALAPGEHHVRVVRRGRAVWAGWVQIAAGATTLELPVPAPVACSLADLAGAHIDGSRVVTPPNVRCRHWAVAVPAVHDDGVRVATCDGSSCGPLLDWQQGFGQDFAGPAQPAEHHKWPGWATYLLAGVGVAATAGIVMWRTGAFEQSGKPHTVWQYQAPLRF